METGKVLAIDDEAPVRQLYGRILTAAGYEVVLAEDGLQALEMAAREPFDVVLMDLVMPQLDGLEAISVLKSSLPQTPIIVVTGHVNVLALGRACEGGADHILLKPFHAAQLLDAIRQVVAQPAQP